MLDLHQHSNLSDGTDSVKQLIIKNKKAGIKVMSITDHDNLDSTKIIDKLDKNFYEIEFINGVEFSTEHRGKTIHILVYGFEAQDKIITQLVETAKELRLKRTNQRLEMLKKEFNIVLDKKNLDIVNKSYNPGKVLIGNILIELGYGSELSSVINKYLYHKFPSSKISTIQLLNQLKNTSAISVYAHPLGGIGEKRMEKEVFESYLAEFLQNGLNGLECYYSLYNKEEQNYLIKTVKNNSLLISGGSDYHGKNKKAKLGELSCYGYKPTSSKLTILKHLKTKTI